MEHSSLVRVTVPLDAETTSLTEAWDISPEELSQRGIESAQLLQEETCLNFKDAQRAAWCSRALIEFQDLQPLPLPQSGRFLNSAYCFLEALAALRESVVSALNGQVHASLAVLRSSLELYCFHYWWRQAFWRTQSLQDFYLWLETGEGGAGFSRIVTELFSSFALPHIATTEEGIRRIYGRLCSYSHKPLLEEAIASHRTSEQRSPIALWLNLVTQTQRAMLDVAIGTTPLAVFPSPLARKFGFTPPLGSFFDAANCLPLSQALGADVIVEYRKHYSHKDPPLSQLKWIQGLPDLTDAQILASWGLAHAPPPANLPFETRLLIGSAMVKAEMRATASAFAYMRITPDAKDLFGHSS